ncbi:Rap1a/Tai family immunity protein [Xanthomonas floridensis]|uniref:Rap1a/Tai family immunity protein n=2 Tax=Xanthomonas floridensis TaxID=1843580 RepID=A0A1A9M6N4_9XANT|nr:Rap1a/Tai family immunity protein [Xanthomonas floridensis]MEA5125598.1 Rap1a/Tai family immunity protein [Xanthomonas floridensis]MEA5133473.1 Rap1a/Tai family immunity protein [Xanthomonas floridensis]OAG65878.1 hypothetical protein A7D17_07505 [Xanthomonas floridensis]
MMASCASVPSVSAASAEARRDWIVSGAELMQAMEGKLGDASRGDELRRQLSSTRANAYVSGVADTTSGVRWCGAGQILPHELVDRVYTYQRSLPAERLQQSAATLVVEALAQAFPCAAKR